MALLKLIVLEAADLPVLSAHLQDAVVRVADIDFSQREKRFVLMGNRFNRAGDGGQSRAGERRRAALRVERVTGVQTQGFDLKARATVLSILAVMFAADPDPSKAPAGVLTLVCAGGAALRFQVECVELVLEDLGPAWQAARRPMHPGG